MQPCPPAKSFASPRALVSSPSSCQRKLVVVLGLLRRVRVVVVVILVVRTLRKIPPRPPRLNIDML